MQYRDAGPVTQGGVASAGLVVAGGLQLGENRRQRVAGLVVLRKLRHSGLIVAPAGMHAGRWGRYERGHRGYMLPRSCKFLSKFL